ncbi:RbsD/FucU family protein [Halostreptopolyspora alba]|uniref:RbsD or FucU transport n=1 Tax=Halostreptopolyspora alba TaxID=2487137 RepID=A0A3N0EC07_9ACTN|nr:RbsD or FucU transport [Nocardiopsaceae bacterium YIM 96095]
MITHRLLHPELLAGLAAAGHGSRILVADALYPHSTGAPATAARVHLNLRPGLVAARDVLEVVADTVHIEAAVYMADANGDESEPVREYRAMLGPHRHSGGREVAWAGLERTEFYTACRSPDVCVLVATGETRPYANLLLTIGVP